MSKSVSAQPAAKKNNPNIYFGTQTLGQAETRPDGKIVRVTMLDPRDPGFVAEQDDKRRVASAEKGSDAMLAAINRMGGYPSYARA